MHRRRVAVLAVLLLVGLLAGCQSVAPQQPATPSLDYDPVAVSVTGPDQLAANETGTMTVRAKLKSSHPEYVRPNATVTAIENVSVTLAPATLVTGERIHSTDRLRIGETETWTFAVCAATPVEQEVTATVDGAARSEGAPANVPSGWIRSTGQTTLSIGDTAANGTTVTKNDAAAPRECAGGEN